MEQTKKIPRPKREGVLSRLLKAKNSTLIDELPIKHLSGVFNDIYVMLGLGDEIPGVEDNSVLLKSVKRMWGGCGYKEVIIAFELAIEGKFDVDLSLYGKIFNLPFLGGVLKAYRRFTDPVLFEHNYRMGLVGDEEEPQPDEDQIRKIMIEGCGGCLKHYRKTGRIKDYGGATHRYLEKIGVISWGNEVSAELLKMAIERLKTTLEVKRSSTSISEGRMVNNQIKNFDEFLNGVQGETWLESIYRELSLKRYFDSVGDDEFNEKIEKNNIH